MVDNVVADSDILDFFHLNTLSVVVSPGVTNAVLEHARPLALGPLAAPCFILSLPAVEALSVATSESGVFGTCLSTIDVQGWTLDFKTLHSDVRDILDLDSGPTGNFEQWSGIRVERLDPQMAGRQDLGKSLVLEVVWCADGSLVVVLVAVDSIFELEGSVLCCSVDCILEGVACVIRDPVRGAALFGRSSNSNLGPRLFSLEAEVDGSGHTGDNSGDSLHL